METKEGRPLGRTWNQGAGGEREASEGGVRERRGQAGGGGARRGQHRRDKCWAKTAERCWENGFSFWVRWQCPRWCLRIQFNRVEMGCGGSQTERRKRRYWMKAILPTSYGMLGNKRVRKWRVKTMRFNDVWILPKGCCRTPSSLLCKTAGRQTHLLRVTDAPWVGRAILLPGLYGSCHLPTSWPSLWVSGTTQEEIQGPHATESNITYRWKHGFWSLTALGSGSSSAA